MQKFVTAAEHGLPIKVFVFNNAGVLLSIWRWKRRAFQCSPEGVTFKNPDSAMFAQSCGGTGFRVTQPDALRETVARALATPGP